MLLVVLEMSLVGVEFEDQPRLASQEDTGLESENVEGRVQIGLGDSVVHFWVWLALGTHKDSIIKIIG